MMRQNIAFLFCLMHSFCYIFDLNRNHYLSTLAFDSQGFHVKLFKLIVLYMVVHPSKKIG